MAFSIRAREPNRNGMTEEVNRRLVPGRQSLTSSRTKPELFVCKHIPRICLCGGALTRSKESVQGRLAMRIVDRWPVELSRTVRGSISCTPTIGIAPRGSFHCFRKPYVTVPVPMLSPPCTAEIFEVGRFNCAICGAPVLGDHVQSVWSAQICICSTTDCR